MTDSELGAKCMKKAERVLGVECMLEPVTSAEHMPRVRGLHVRVSNTQHGKSLGFP